MRIGVMMHVTDESVSPVTLAVESEIRGFDSVFVTEHTHIPVRAHIPFRRGTTMPDEYKRLHDPYIALATAASATRTIRLGTGVTVIGQREPLATAKQLASLDRLSNGRLLLGTGYGWEADELANHGIAWAQRESVWREHLLAMRALWRDDESAFSGEHVRFDRPWSYPKPTSPGGPPVWLGAGGSRQHLIDVVDVADGWMPVEGTEPLEQRLAELQEIAEERNRDPASIDLVIYGSSGDPAVLDHYQQLGVSLVVVATAAHDTTALTRQLDQHAQLVERYAQAMP